VPAKSEKVFNYNGDSQAEKMANREDAIRGAHATPVKRKA